MSEQCALECAELSKLLTTFYRMEPVAGSAYMKNFRITDEDLQSLITHKKKLRELVVSALSAHGKLSLSIDSKYITKGTLPERPYHDELATAGLHCIAKALHERHSLTKSKAHLQEASALIKEAEEKHKATDFSEVSAEIQGLQNHASILEGSLKAKKLKASKGGKTSSRTANKQKQIEQLVLLINKHLYTYKADYETTYAKDFPNSATPLQKILFPILKSCQSNGTGFMGLSPEETKSSILSGNVLREALLKSDHCKG